MQQSYVVVNDISHLVELPDAQADLLPGVRWGHVEAIGSPAQWFYLVQARRLMGGPIRSKLGETLKEEVAACLLGGHGIPASVGLAAFQSLKNRGLFSTNGFTQEEFLKWLTEPLLVNDRLIRYRFAKQKSRYLAHAMHYLDCWEAPLQSGRALRDWLLAITGIGLKTASWITRNWLHADDVAILDIHILRAGILAGFYSPNLSVEKDYLALEAKFIEFSQAIGIPTSELDAEIWWQFSRTPSVVHRKFDAKTSMPGRNPKRIKSFRAHHGHTDTLQQSLF